jgi:hypothetical protein
MGKGLQLFFHCCDNFRMAMPGIEHRNPGGEIDDFVAFHIPQRRVFCFLGIEAAHHANTTRCRL